MGTVYTATCPKCNYTGDFCLGYGLSSINLLSSIRVLSENEQKLIEEMISNREISNFLVENKLTECLHCGTSEKLKDKTIITITKQNSHDLVFGNNCSDCSEELLTYENTNDVSCPCCKDSSLTFEETGRWD